MNDGSLFVFMDTDMERYRWAYIHGYRASDVSDSLQSSVFFED
jgi:hypothetical protein